MENVRRCWGEWGWERFGMSGGFLFFGCRELWIVFESRGGLSKGILE